MEIALLILIIVGLVVICGGALYIMVWGFYEVIYEPYKESKRSRFPIKWWEVRKKVIPENWYTIPREEDYPYNQRYEESVPRELQYALLETAVALTEVGKCRPHRPREFSHGDLLIRTSFHYVDTITMEGGGWAEEVVDSTVKQGRKWVFRCRYGTVNSRIIKCGVDLDKLSLLTDVNKACLDMSKQLRAKAEEQLENRAKFLASKTKNL